MSEQHSSNYMSEQFPSHYPKEQYSSFLIDTPGKTFSEVMAEVAVLVERLVVVKQGVSLDKVVNVSVSWLPASESVEVLVIYKFS